jgi:hypothetical protein
MPCFCQRALDTDFTGDPSGDAWIAAKIEKGQLYPGWFRHAYNYHAYRDGDRDYAPQNPPHADVIRWKEQVEAACPATRHYPSLFLDDLAGRTVFTSFENERIDQDLDRAEMAQCLARGGRWYDADDRDGDERAILEAASEGTVTDVLTYQRLSRPEKAIIDGMHAAKESSV